MFGPFSLWSPTFRFPLSGDVKQDIDPEFSTQIAGIPEIELAVIRDVASYGKQLGKVHEALKLLADNANVSLPEIEGFIDDVEAVKAASKDVLKRRAQDALDRLKAADEAAWKDVIGQ